MNKFLFYILLILIFLGLSKGLSIGRKDDTLYVEEEKKLSTLFEGRPLSIILIDHYETGMIIKTYYHKYKLVYDYKAPQVITVKTSKQFTQDNLDHIGLSLFRRTHHGNESFLPSIPGSLYLGNQAYGHWNYNRKRKEKYWVFHRTYQNLTKIFGWGNFVANYDFYKNMLLAFEEKRVFYGTNHEFGTKGKITQKNFPEFFHKKDGHNITLKDFFRKILKRQSKRISYERNI